MSKQLEIRNSTAEFLIFQAEGKEDGIQVVYKDETIWCTQKAMAALFDVDRSVITKHLKTSLNSTNSTKIQYVQFLHILLKMVKHTTPNSIISTPSSPLVIELIR